KYVLKIASAVAFILILSSCGNGSKDEKGSLTDKRAQLEKLKNDQKKLNDQIAKLQNEIGSTDTSSSLNKGKLVAASPVTEQAFEHYIDLQGHIDADNISYVTPRGGPAQAKAVYIKQGDFVKKGQIIAKLDDDVQLKQLQQLKTQLAYAEDVYRRQKNLWDQGIGTEIQLKTAENNVNNLKDQINTTTAGWEMTNVRSEVTGYVETMNLRVGEVLGNTPQPQIVIVNSSTLKAVTDIPENYLGKIHKGMPVNIKLPDVNLEFNSSISLMNQTIGLNNRAVTTESKIPYNPNVHINQVAQVRIKDYANPRAIVIPLTVLQTDENGKYVYVMDTENGKKVAKKKIVQVGEIYGNNIEVKGGLNVGDQLITEGFQSLYEGQAVTTS
ncbi:MAG TPA: efflux RND transporter periplasmic adaptor subunit, partial [Chitinophagaceae bacterium]|nr:efflux RND transporter periplasmic adaptor subunit [Chitinophagaceae bacterium]